jgi:hypothetical protein
VLSSAKPLRLHWDAETGWVIDTPTGLSQPQIDRIVAWSLPKQIDRWRSLPPSEKKVELESAIDLLRAGRVSQRIVGERGDGKGDVVAFEATERSSSKVYG